MKVGFVRATAVVPSHRRKRPGFPDFPPPPSPSLRAVCCRWLAQTACREFGLDAGSSSLVLKHKRNVVDLSQPFRFTGIPQNATLELVVRFFFLPRASPSCRPFSGQPRRAQSLR